MYHISIYYGNIFFDGGVVTMASPGLQPTSVRLNVPLQATPLDKPNPIGCAPDLTQNDVFSPATDNRKQN